MSQVFEDIDLKAALDFFVDKIGDKNWEKRKSEIELIISIKYKNVNIPLDSPESEYSIDEDKFGWYLYLLDSYIYHRDNYEFVQGASVIPIFKVLGKEIDKLKKIQGSDDRIDKMISKRNNHPDGDLFEILVALVYSRNNWPHISFINEKPPYKTPDLFVKKGKREIYVECKRMLKISDYSKIEHSKWLEIWEPVICYLLKNNMPFLLDFVFHKELLLIETNYLEKVLIPKLKLIGTKGKVIDNEIATIKVDFVDFKKIEEKMNRQKYIKYPSTGLLALSFGKNDTSRKYTVDIKGDLYSNNKTFFKSISFVCGAVWNCDAEVSILKRSRNIKSNLITAFKQLPSDKPSIIHLGLDSYEGSLVENIQTKRINNTVLSFETKGKDLKWIYCHIFNPQVPIDRNFILKEELHPFQNISSKGTIKPPLKNPQLINTLQTLKII